MNYRLLEDEKLEVVHQIIRNGIAIMHRISRLPSEHPHNTSAWDCAIGLRNTTTALELYGKTVPEFVRNTLEIHLRQEKCHCCFKTKAMTEELAVKISDFHDRVLREHGLLSYLACMPLGGERAALAEAVFFHYPDDPHASLQGALSEVYHQTLAVIDLMILAEYNTLEKLKQAETDQREVMKMLRVEERDFLLLGADGDTCTKPTMEAHNV